MLGFSNVLVRQVLIFLDYIHRYAQDLGSVAVNILTSLMQQPLAYFLLYLRLILYLIFVSENLIINGQNNFAQLCLQTKHNAWFSARKS